MGPDLDTLATALYVTTDDLLIRHPDLASGAARGGDRPEAFGRGVGHPGGDPGAAALRFRGPFPALRPHPSETLVSYLPKRAGYNERLHRSVRLLQHVISWLARDSPSWSDELWLVDSERHEAFLTVRWWEATASCSSQRAR